MKGVMSAIVASRMMPIRNMKISAIEKFQSLKMRIVMNGRFAVKRIGEKEIEAGDGQDQFDPDLGRFEPAELLAAVKHHLQGADAERQAQEAEPREGHVAPGRRLAHEE